MQVDTSSPSGMEVIKAVSFVEMCKASEPERLLPSFFKDGDRGVNKIVVVNPRNGKEFQGLV